MGVSLNAIFMSIALAGVHGFLEAIYLKIEAQAAKTTFLNYCIVCFNGRFNWVPYNDYLISMTTEKDNTDEDVNSANSKVQLDFQNVTTRAACFDISVEFNFTNNTL